MLQVGADCDRHGNSTHGVSDSFLKMGCHQSSAAFRSSTNLHLAGGKIKEKNKTPQTARLTIQFQTATLNTKASKGCEEKSLAPPVMLLPLYHFQCLRSEGGGPASILLHVTAALCCK